MSFTRRRAASDNSTGEGRQALTIAVIARVMAAAAAKIERIAEMAFMATDPMSSCPEEMTALGRRDKLAHRV